MPTKVLKKHIIIIIILLFTISCTIKNDDYIVRWRYIHSYSDNITSELAIGEDGTLYFGSFGLLFRGLYALKPNEILIGKNKFLAAEAIKWKFKICDPIFYYPNIDKDGTIYFYTDYGYFFVLDREGNLKWCRKSLKNYLPAIDTNGTIYAIIPSERLDYYSKTDTSLSIHLSLFALTPDGKEKWFFLPYEEEKIGNDKKIKKPQSLFSFPVIGIDGTIYVTSTENLYAITTDGKLKWKWKMPGAYSITPPAIGPDGTIYAGATLLNEIFSLTPEGKFKWYYENEFCSSLIVGIDGTIYFASRDKYFYALTPNGKLKWRYKVRIKGDAIGGICVYPAIGSDGTIYFTTKDGVLYALRPNGELKWRFKVEKEDKKCGKETDFYTSPVVSSDGTIYFGFNNRLYAIKDKTVKPTEKHPWPCPRQNNRNTGRIE